MIAVIPLLLSQALRWNEKAIAGQLRGKLIEELSGSLSIPRDLKFGRCMDLSSLVWG